MKKRDDVLVGMVMAVAIIVAIIGSLWLARGGLSKGYAAVREISVVIRTQAGTAGSARRE